jgi:4-aminobutyrate aminotransferase-like enzyme/Ser/Thr protein kinase RdoA (MazF antagonist)
MSTSPRSQSGQAGAKDETNTVLEAPAPALSTREAEAIAQRVFDIEASAHPLDSERDQNFQLRAKDGSEWVLKIANPAENPALLEMQTQALLHIAQVDPSLAIPRVKATSDGALFDEIDGADERRFIVRVLSYLPGQLLDDATLHPALLRDVGAMTARLARAMRGFFHPAARHELLWDLTQAPALRMRTHHIEDQGRRQVVEEIFDHFDTVVLPQLKKQRAQLIHNDVSCNNTLVDGNRVTGVIDFGDLIHAPLVCDLAVPIAELIREHPDPIGAAAEITSGYHAVTALEDDELRLIFDLVITRCAMEVAVANWRVCDHPENTEYIMAGITETGAQLDQMREWGADRMYTALRRACATPVSVEFSDFNDTSETTTQSLIERRSQLLGPELELSYDNPVHVVRGEGVWLIDDTGRSLLDAYNNVPSVGHCHPTVVQALARQAATLNTNTRYLYKSVIEYADRLTATMPGDLSVCMFVCSGSEANDLAWRLAKAHTGNSGGIVMEDAYHGTTDAVYELSPADYGIDNGRSLAEHIATVPAPDGYRGRFRRDDPQYLDRYSACFDDAIESLHSRGFAPAAYYLDLVLCSNGIMVPPPGYLSAAFSKVRAAGGLCVADEVQSGFGRSGDHLWGFQAHDVVPDIVTLGKPIGNGLSMAAVVTTPAIVASLMQETDFFSTTGGNPVACAVGLAVLDVLEQEGLQERAARVGSKLRSQIEKLADQHPLIGEVRGAGLFIGVELVRDHSTLEPAAKETQAVVNRMRDLGVLVGIEGPFGNVLKIRPPLVFDENHAQQLTDTLDQALREMR